MAKQRYIDTKFWTDNYIQSIDPKVRYFYLYILTNPLTNISGSYEISLRTMEFDTGYPMDTLSYCIDTLSKDKKIIYFNGWIRIINFVKHQSTTSQKVISGINECISKIPKEIYEKLYPMDTLSEGIIYLNRDLNLNLNTNDISLIKYEPKNKELKLLVSYGQLVVYIQKLKLDQKSEQFLISNLKALRPFDVYQAWEMIELAATRIDSKEKNGTSMEGL